MNLLVLIAFYYQPVSEVLRERKSFLFRPGLGNRFVSYKFKVS